MGDPKFPAEVYLERIASDMKIIREQLGKALTYMADAESEVHEKMRRFVMYMHDMQDVKNMYQELGLEVPSYVMREVERCDDRLRQMLSEQHSDGGTFEKVRREMAKDPENRWDHTRQLERKPI